MINLVVIASFPKRSFDLTSYQQYMSYSDPYFTITWDSHLVNFNLSVFIIVALIFLIIVKLNIFACLVAILIALLVKCQFVFLAHISILLFAFSLLII